MLSIILSAWEAIGEYLITNYPFLLIILLVAYLTYKVTATIFHWKNRVEVTEKDCKSLKSSYIPDLHNKFGQVDKKLSTLIISVNKISYHITTTAGLDANVFAVHSPIELTEIGVKILEDVGGKDYIDKNLQEFILYLEDKKPKSGLDVQNLSNLLITEKTVDDGFVGISNYIFQNPIYKMDGGSTINLDLGIVTQILGIYLRNKYFEKYPDLKKDL